MEPKSIKRSSKNRPKIDPEKWSQYDPKMPSKGSGRVRDGIKPDPMLQTPLANYI